MPGPATSTFKANLLEPVAASYNPLEDFVFTDGRETLTMRRAQ